MAWSSLSLPSGYWPADDIYVSNGRGLLPASGGAWFLTDDFASWRMASAPTDFTPWGATFDGTRWYVGGMSSKIARSLDGAAGLAWEIITPTSPSGFGVGRLLAVAGGRLINQLGTQLSTSDDGGYTWVVRKTMPSVGGAAAGLRLYDSGAITAVGYQGRVAWSLDNGTTWDDVEPASFQTPLTLAHAGTNGWAASLAGNRAILFSLPTPPDDFNGTNSANGAHEWLIDAAGEVFYAFARVSGEMRVLRLPSSFASDAVMEPLDNTGLVHDLYPWRFWATAGRLVLWSTNSGTVYSMAIGGGGGDTVALLWPVDVIDPSYATTPWPVDVTLPAASSASLAWPVKVAAPTAASVSWPVSVIDGDVLGGLDGAAGWAAAPDGLWQAVVVLGDDDISAHVGPVSVQIAADAARTAEFSFRPVAPLQPLSLIGRRVRIAFAQAGGLNLQPVFTGAVDVPSVDVQTGLITCACTDQAQQILAAQSRESIDALVGGRWHVAVSGEPKDSFAHLRERIQSVPASWALDVHRSPRVLPWRAPARTATVRTADVIEGTLAVDLPSREQLRSRITCRLQYRYPVLRWRVVQAQYSQPVDFFLPSLGVSAVPSKTWLTRSMVASATDRVPGWDLVTRSIESPPARAWVLGPSAAVYSIPADVAPTLATGFAARYRSRWRQSITEDYSVTVTWPWLESQLPAPAGEEIGATIDAPFEQPAWDSDSTVQPDYALAYVGDHALPWQPTGATTSDRDAALATLLDRAWVRLWAASRSGRVRFALPCRPDMWLDWRITLEHAAMRAQGDVVEIEHVLDNQTGEATTALTLAVGLPGNTAATIPAWPALGVPPPVPAPASGAYSFEIGTYVGGAAGVAPFDEAEMIGFCTNYERRDPGLEYYPHQLSMRAPALSSADRDPATASISAELAVDVPTDLLEIL